jgi:hypothetical protein
MHGSKSAIISQIRKGALVGSRVFSRAATFPALDERHIDTNVDAARWKACATK